MAIEFVRWLVENNWIPTHKKYMWFNTHTKTYGLDEDIYQEYENEHFVLNGNTEKSEEYMRGFTDGYDEGLYDKNYK